MTSVVQLSRQEARRIAVRAQLLDAAPAETDLMGVVRHLSAVQVDGTKAVAPSADLVLWSRLGSAYSPQHLEAALADRTIVDLRGILRPAEDIELYLDDMARWPGTDDDRHFRFRQHAWVVANDGCRRDILRTLRESGPLRAGELPDTCAKPWASSGWNNNKNVPMLLDFMQQMGQVAIVGRIGRDRVWDLAERVYPAMAPVPFAEAERRRDERRLRSLGIARARAAECPVEPHDAGDAGVAAVVEGVRGEWRVDPEQLDRPFDGRAALLSPLDRLVYDRARMVDLFEFDYALEMYKPAADRKWGYFALPILWGDRLVGKLDATTDKKKRTLRVDALHEDEPFTRQMAVAVDREIIELTQWVEQTQFA
jgi:uncharacterized protein YcaQ